MVRSSVPPRKLLENRTIPHEHKCFISTAAQTDGPFNFNTSRQISLCATILDHFKVAESEESAQTARLFEELIGADFVELVANTQVSQGCQADQPETIVVDNGAQTAPKEFVDRTIQTDAVEPMETLPTVQADFGGRNISRLGLELKTPQVHLGTQTDGDVVIKAELNRVKPNEEDLRADSPSEQLDQSANEADMNVHVDESREETPNLSLDVNADETLSNIGDLAETDQKVPRRNEIPKSSTWAKGTSMKILPAKPAAKRPNSSASSNGEIRAKRPRNESRKVGKLGSFAGRKTPASETPADVDAALLVSTLVAQFSRSPSKLVPKLAELMSSRMDSIQIQLECHRLIGQYSPYQLTWLNEPQRRFLLAVLMSVMKLHSDDRLIVESTCNLLLFPVDNHHVETDLYLVALDFLMEMFSGENDMTTAAKKSSLKMLEKLVDVALLADWSGMNRKCAEAIGQFIRRQLEKAEYDELLSISWDSLNYKFVRRGAKQLFLHFEGINLFHRCYEKFNDQTELVYNMINLMFYVSEDKAIRQHLTTEGNLSILWEIWAEPQYKEFSSCCARIFNNLLAVGQADWPVGQPTIDQVMEKLNRKGPKRYKGIRG